MGDDIVEHVRGAVGVGLLADLVAHFAQCAVDETVLGIHDGGL